MSTDRARAAGQARTGFGALVYGIGLLALALGGARSSRATGGYGRSYPPPVLEEGGRLAPGRIIVADAPMRPAWGAILAGAVISLASLLVVAAAGSGVALTLYDPAADLLSMELHPMALIGGGLAALACLFLGGWMAGRLAGAMRRRDGVLHGLAAWALVSIVLGYLGLSVVSYVTDRAAQAAAGAVSVAARSLAAVAVGAAGVAAGVSPDAPLPRDALASEAGDLLRQAVLHPDDTLQKVERAIEGIERLMTEPSPSAPTSARPGMPGPAVDRATMVALIAQQTGAPLERAALGLDEWQASAPANLQDRSRALMNALRGEADSFLRSLRSDAGSMLERISDRLAWALWLGAAGLLAMAVAACLGGALGAKPGRITAR
jgi:hypothetical protein